MNNGTTESTDLDIETVVDNRTALYDQLEAKPYRLLQEEVTELITSTVKAAGGDARDVETALMSDPLDEDWWFSITTQQALDGIVIASDEGLVRIDISYELGDERDLRVPSPDALPILDEETDLTIYCLLNRDIELSSSTGNVTIESVVTDADTEPKQEPKKAGSEPEPDRQNKTDEQDDGSTDTGAVTVSLRGPEGQQDSIKLPQDQTIGFVVTELKQSYDVYDAEIGLYEDERYSKAIKNSSDPSPYDEKTVYWRVERRAA